jgi:putative transposase
MGRRPKPEEIVSKLRQVDVLVSQGKSVAESVRSIGVTEVTYLSVAEKVRRPEA